MSCLSTVRSGATTSLPASGISIARTAGQMGHVPLSGTGGTLEAFARLTRPRVILVHINNTNPVLLERSPERDAVHRAGVEVGYDGLEVGSMFWLRWKTLSGS